MYFAPFFMPYPMDTYTQNCFAQGWITIYYCSTLLGEIANGFPETTAIEYYNRNHGQILLKI